MQKNIIEENRLVDADTLVDYVKKSIKLNTFSSVNIGFVDEIVKRIILFDTKFTDIFKKDRETIFALIQFLGKLNQREALFSFLSNFEIAHDDYELFRIIFEVGLNGDFKKGHKWITEYDVVGQRIEMILNQIVPFIEETAPEKKLFRALKMYEAEKLKLNASLIDAEGIYDLISLVRRGEHLMSKIEFRSRCKGLRQVRFVFPNEIFNTLLSLAWMRQDYVYDLVDRYGPGELIELLQLLNKVIPVYLVATHLCYPMGGGESVMHQTCRMLSEMGIKCVWVSFRDVKNHRFNVDKTAYTPYYIDVRYKGGCSLESIQRAVDQYNPDLIHSQGDINTDVMEVAEKNRLHAMVGYHFWGGLVKLGETNNNHILDNKHKHKLITSHYSSSRFVWRYVASEFMCDVWSALGGRDRLNVLHPLSDSAHFLSDLDEGRQFVFQANIAFHKGGGIFLDCVKKLGDKIPFIGIQTEPGGEVEERIQSEVAKHSLCELHGYGSIKDFYGKSRMVIIPTLVDETFCRVAYEAVMNGVPVISTANGYLPYMLGESGVYLSEDSSEWVALIEELYDDKNRLNEIAKRQYERVKLGYKHDFRDFLKVAMDKIDSSPMKNIGIFGVWGDIGMGNLSHLHARLLREMGYRVHIFSFQPYEMIGKSLVQQSNPGDWSTPKNADSVYYSFNNREEVTVYELSQFLISKDIHTLLVSEVCWKSNWERLEALEVGNLKVCTLPMTEIVIKNEILRHNRLTTTLFCTHEGQNVLGKKGVTNGAYLGHGFGLPMSREQVDDKCERLAQGKKIRFLHVAGHNPVARKNTPQIIEAFIQVLSNRSDIELTITSVQSLDSYFEGIIPEGIQVIDRGLSREEILELYREHDVSIQVSSHEGLGLGFYESIACGTPVISLDATPHNEVVLDGKTGWLIPAMAVPVPDNKRSVVTAWKFKTSDLVTCILSLKKEEIGRVMRGMVRIYSRQFDEVALLTRFLQVLPRGVGGNAKVRVGYKKKKKRLKKIKAKIKKFFKRFK